MRSLILIKVLYTISITSLSKTNEKPRNILDINEAPNVSYDEDKLNLALRMVLAPMVSGRSGQVKSFYCNMYWLLLNSYSGNFGFGPTVFLY